MYTWTCEGEFLMEATHIN